MKPLQSASILAIVCCTIPLLAADPDEKQQSSVLDVMTAVITPATNTIWGIENPASEAEWQVFIDAAEQVIAATTQIKSGGSGPNDSDWARDPRWQRFADILIDAAADVREAAIQQDLETLIEVSNDNMYPPCEDCHLEFLPAFQQEESN